MILRILFNKVNPYFFVLLFAEAVTLLQESKPRKEIGFTSRSSAWQVLQAVADTTKDPELVKKVLNVLVDNRYVDINNVILGPVMKAYLLR